MFKYRKYENGQLSCLGNGLVGVINDVKSSLFGIIAFGQLVHNGITYPIAHYNGTTWAYYTHPSIPNAVAQSGYVSDYYSEIAIDGNTGGQEIWSLDFANNVWEQKAKTNGVVLTIISSDTGQIYAGHFDTIITFSSQIDTIGNLYNVIIHDSTNTNWFSLGSEIPDTIKIVKEIGGKLYFGGACSMPNNPTCLSRLQGDSLNAILLSNDLTPFGIPGPFFTSVNSIFSGGSKYHFNWR